MKRTKKALKVFSREGLLGCSFLVLLFVQITSFASESFAGELRSARVLEMEGIVESKMPGETIRFLEPGDFVETGEELSVSPESWVALVMADSTVRKFNGPATVIIRKDLSKTGGGILARLGSAVVGALFSREPEGSEVVMTTRRIEGSKETGSYLPLLVHPAPGSSVLEKPIKFAWRKVEGVPLYRVSVYSSDRLLWQGTTSDADIDCPSEQCNLVPGEPYYWVVEGLVGNSTLRSKAAEFKILSEDKRSELYQALREVDSSTSDSKLSALIKVRLCLNSNLYDKALDLIESHWTEGSLDRRAYMLRAQVKEKMGLLEDAFFDYKRAASMPAAK